MDEKNENMVLTEAQEAPAAPAEPENDIVHQKAWQYLVAKNSVSDERLDAPAVIDQRRTYSYRQMFRNWQKYAEVFTGLGITEKNHSRLAIFDANCAESTFALYACNMTGASVSGMLPLFLTANYPLDKAIEEEHITDLLINDLVVTDDMLTRLLEKKEEMGIRNIILVRIPFPAQFAGEDLAKMARDNYRKLKKLPGVLLMEDLLETYEATPISYASDEIREDAFIAHTSGTTKGVCKPVPLSDLALNAAAESNHATGFFTAFDGKKCTVNASNSVDTVYGLVNQLHSSLSYGCGVVLLPLGSSNPFFNQSIGYYKLDVIYVTPLFFEVWQKMSAEEAPDLTSVKYCVSGGVYMSAEAKKRFTEFARQHGSNLKIINGYGSSETGGACILQTEDIMDDSIGYPMPGVDVLLYDEEAGQYYPPEPGRSGILYIHSDSISHGKVDDNVFFENDIIDGKAYVCTNDMVVVNPNGSLVCTGRANRYFVDNDGVKFNAGLVETCLSAEPSLEACALVPWYDKLLIHDTVPVLYAKTKNGGEKAEAEVLTALKNVFMEGGSAADSNMPVQAVIVDSLPYNASGKVDIHRIAHDGLPGRRYIIRPMRADGKLQDIILEPVAPETTGVTNSALPKELTALFEGTMASAANDKTVNNIATFIVSSRAAGMPMEQIQQMMAMQQAAEQMPWLVDMVKMLGSTPIGSGILQMLGVPQLPGGPDASASTAMQAAPQNAQPQAGSMPGRFPMLPILPVFPLMPLMAMSFFGRNGQNNNQ